MLITISSLLIKKIAMARKTLMNYNKIIAKYNQRDRMDYMFDKYLLLWAKV